MVSKASRGACFALSLTPVATSGVELPSFPLDQEILENELTLASIEGGTTGHARYFAIYCWPRRGFNPNDLVLSRAVRALKR